MTISSAESLDVLLVLRSCAEHYPPTVNQANLLAESGLAVGMLDLSTPLPSSLDKSIHRWQPHAMWNSKLEPPYPPWKRWRNWLLFKQACQKLIRTTKPKVVIAYDTLGSIFVTPGSRHYRTIYHFHELTGPEPRESFGPRLARLKTAERSRRADLVVFSDLHRARLFEERARLDVCPKVIMNCPRRLENVPSSSLRSCLRDQAGARVVCYLGSIGNDQGVREAAASMRWWPADTLFVLIGGTTDAMRTSILDQARQAGDDGRVLFLGPYPYSEALALAAGADLGVSLVQPNNESWRYSAGAINKRFEYMALKLPQVTNDGPGVREIVQSHQCGLCVDSGNPEAIGTAIRQLLEDASLRQQQSLNARAAHLDTFNYERQFSEVAAWIRKACALPNAKLESSFDPALSSRRAG